MHAHEQMDQEWKEFQTQQINKKTVNLTHSRPVEWTVWNMGTDSNSTEGQGGNDILFCSFGIAN